MIKLNCSALAMSTCAQPQGAVPAGLSEGPMKAVSAVVPSTAMRCNLLRSGHEIAKSNAECILALCRCGLGGGGRVFGQGWI